MTVAAGCGLALTAWLLGTQDPPLAALPAELLGAALLGARCVAGRDLALALLFPALGLLAAARSVDDRLPAVLDHADVIVPGVVCEFVAPRDGVARFRFEPLSGAPAGLPAALRVAWYYPERVPAIGEAWVLRLRLRGVRGLANVAGADAERRSLLEGVGATAYVRRSVLNRPVPRPPGRCALGAWRGAVASAVEARLGERRATGYLLALAVGARHRLSGADWDLLRATGTVHLMAISGLHVGLVAGLAWVLGRGLRRVVAAAALPAPAGLPPLLALGAATGYAALAGFAVPTVRALAMVTVATALLGTRRGPDPWRGLALALCCVLAPMPLAALSAGLWLSFAAVAVLLAGGAAVGAPRVPRRWLADAALAQARLTLGLAPLTAAWFQQLSWVAPVVNLVIVPLFAVAVVPAALAGALLAWLGGPTLPLDAAAVLVDIAVAGLEAAAARDWSAAGVAWPGAWALVAGGLGLAWLGGPRPLPARGLAAVLLLPLLMPAVPARDPTLRIDVLDVGQGLAVLVRTRRHALLYDAGPGYPGGDAGAAVVVPVLRRFGLRRLDTLMISHGDRDHAGGMASVRAAFPEARLIAAPGVAAGTACRAGQQWRWDDVVFRVLSPPRGPPAGSDNDASCVLAIDAGAAGSVLLAGDVGRGPERRLALGGALGPVDLVLVAHHGSATSSSPRFVATTRPRYAVVSAGYRNRWGFPRADVVARWSRAGACLLNTAEHGALAFVGGPDGLVFGSAVRAARPRAWRARPAPPPPCGAPRDSV